MKAMTFKALMLALCALTMAAPALVQANEPFPPAFDDEVILEDVQ